MDRINDPYSDGPVGTALLLPWNQAVLPRVYFVTKEDSSFMHSSYFETVLLIEEKSICLNDCYPFEFHDSVRQCFMSCLLISGAVVCLSIFSVFAS